jgi:GTP-binding protein Era
MSRSAGEPRPLKERIDMEESRETNLKRRSGIVAIAGRPNVGKSTLLNQLLGQKISIVSHKAQTTRQQVLGILTGEAWQIVFIDTPGVMEPHDSLQEYMLQASFRAVSGADMVLMITEANVRDVLEEQALLERLRGVDVPRLLLINKIDLIDKSRLLPLIAKFHATGLFDSILPVSALTGDGLTELTREIVSRLPESPFLYSEDQLATQPMRFFAAELVRETLYEMLHDELPYASTVIVDEYKERPKNKIFVRTLIYVERESQKKIIIGRKGDQLKRIGQAARLKIEEFTGNGVYLELWVKVREKWRKDSLFLKQAGFDPQAI